MQPGAQKQVLLAQLENLELEYAHALYLGFVCVEDLPFQIQNLRFRLNELEMCCFCRSMPSQQALSIYDFV